MTIEHHESRTFPKHARAKYSNGARHPLHAINPRGEALAHRAKGFLSMLPENIKDQFARHPYRAFGGALAVGLGAGIVLGSTILRAALVTAASVAMIEIGRDYLQREVKQALGLHPGDPADAIAS